MRPGWSIDIGSSTVLPAGALVVSVDKGSQVAAFEAETGRRVWRYPFASMPVAVAGGQVLVRGGRAEVHVLALETGRPLGCIPHGSFDSARIAAIKAAIVLLLPDEQTAEGAA